MGKNSLLDIDAPLNIGDTDITLEEGATSRLRKGYTNNIVSAHSSTLLLKTGSKTIADNYVNLNGGHLIMEQDSSIYVNGDLHFHHSNATDIAGVIRSTGTVMFHEPAVTLTCGVIITDTLSNMSEIPPLQVQAI